VAGPCARPARHPKRKEHIVPVLKKSARGVQGIRTLGGMSAERKLPHQAYLRIACLEMERFRKGQERQSAMRRVESIDSRCAQITSEQTTLMSSLGVAGIGPRRETTAAPKTHEEPSGPPPASGTSGFTIRY
jgi:hypothetical protein